MFIYIRVSGKDQISGDGPIRQEKACRDYCTAHGLTVAQVFFEQVCGDIETMDRPAFIEMIARLMAGDVKTIIATRCCVLTRPSST